MPSVVACPSCQKRYKLPDNFDAKRIRCKACNKLFSPGGSRRESAAGTTPGPGSGAPGLGSMGLSQIKQQPDLFGNAPAGGADPLRNHVVQDPGFQNAASDVPTAGLVEVPEHASAEDADILANPFMKSGGGGSRVDATAERERRRKKEDELLNAYEIPSAGLGKGRKQKAANEFPGFGRGLYFLANIGLGFCVFGLIFLVLFFTGAALKVTDGNEAAGSIVLILGAVCLFVVSGIGQGWIVRQRISNMCFRNPAWKNAGATIMALPLLLNAASAVFSFLGISALLAIQAFLIPIVSLCGLPVALACLILPGNFARNKKLDFWSWLVIGFAVAFFIAFVVVAILQVSYLQEKLATES